MANKLNDIGFIIRKTQLKETDLIIDIYTKNSGLKTVYAFKARSPKSKKRTLLEIMNLVKFSTNSPKSANLLPILQEVDIISEFKLIKNADRFHVHSFLIAEIISKVSQFDDSDESFFNVLEQISQIRTDDKLSPDLITLFVISKLLYLQGFVTEFTSDINTGLKLDPTKKIEKSHIEPGYVNDLSSNDVNQNIITEIKVLNNLILAEDFSLIFNLKLDPEVAKSILMSLINMTEMVIESELKSKNLLNS